MDWESEYGWEIEIGDLDLGSSLELGIKIWGLFLKIWVEDYDLELNCGFYLKLVKRLDRRS